MSEADERVGESDAAALAVEYVVETPGCPRRIVGVATLELDQGALLLKDGAGGTLGVFAPGAWRTAVLAGSER